ncbi:unnamed protein product, partial [Ectocarpus sp. 13 AM-2016]
TQLPLSSLWLRAGQRFQSIRERVGVPGKECRGWCKAVASYAIARFDFSAVLLFPRDDCAFFWSTPYPEPSRNRQCPTTLLRTWMDTSHAWGWGIAGPFSISVRSSLTQCLVEGGMAPIASECSAGAMQHGHNFLAWPSPTASVDCCAFGGCGRRTTCKICTERVAVCATSLHE